MVKMLKKSGTTNMNKSRSRKIALLLNDPKCFGLKKTNNKNNTVSEVEEG